MKDEWILPHECNEIRMEWRSSIYIYIYHLLLLLYLIAYILSYYFKSHVQWDKNEIWEFPSFVWTKFIITNYKEKDKEPNKKFLVAKIAIKLLP